MPTRGGRFRRPDGVKVLLCALAALREGPRRLLLHYAAADGRPYVRHRWQVDFYIVESANPQRHEYFRRLFSNNPDQRTRRVPVHYAVNFPTEISALEAELHRVLGMCEEDESALAKSTMPQVDGMFLASLNKLRHEFEKRLHRAKAERRTQRSG